MTNTIFPLNATSFAWKDVNYRGKKITIVKKEYS